MYQNVNINEIDKLVDVEIIDIRSKKEFALGHIRNAKNIEMVGLLYNHELFLNKETSYYIYSSTG